MARECTLVHETSLPIPFTCADGAAIPKGSLMEISDPMTVTISNGDADPIVGIAAEEKIASDGKTTIGVYMNGIFKGYAGGGGVTVGKAIDTDVATGDTNELVDIPNDGERIVGIALESATDGQTFMFQLNPISVEHA